jgi:hypothetical protein
VNPSHRYRTEDPVDTPSGEALDAAQGEGVFRIYPAHGRRGGGE